MKPFKKAVMVLMMVAVTGGIAWGAFAKPDAAIAYRKAVMQVIGQHFGQMAGVVKGGQPYDQATFELDARIVALMATLPWEASLAPGSYGEGTTLKERALKNREDYMAAAKAFEAAGQELLTAAQGGDLGAIKSKFGFTAQTCSRCHKAYRK